MDFSGFVNADFDFFKKKGTMSKAEYDEKKEDVKRHFREFCYEIQKSFYSASGGTLVLEKNFQGLNKNKNSISAISQIDRMDLLNLKIELSQDNVLVGLICPYNGDYLKFEALKKILDSERDMFIKFFKENKSISIMLYSRNFKKSGDDNWSEEYRFNNNELSIGSYDILINNMEKLQPSEYNNKKLAGIHIGAQFSKSDSTRMGKVLAARCSTEIIKLVGLCKAIE